MIEGRTKIRVRYAETDQMGFVYYGHYATYFEIGRVAALKTIGIAYRDLEENGQFLPVKELHIDYKRAAKYDDEIEIITRIEEMPSNRIRFDYEILREQDLLVSGYTVLFFMNREGRPCKPSEDFIQSIKPFFS